MTLQRSANSQVSVAGALHVINEKLQRKHDSTIQEAETRPLHL